MTETGYGANAIQVLKGLEAVRKRPAMYIGDTGERGLHHLIWESVDNSIDEAMAGHCTAITIRLHGDGSVSVMDNGRGIPVEIHPTEGVPAVQVVLTKLHAGGKFDEKAYGASGGLHGVGVSCVNALSESLTVEVKRDGFVWQQRYSRGVPQDDLQKIDTADSTGTLVRFKPDPEIFPVIKFDPDVIRKRIKSLTYLNPGVTFQFRTQNIAQVYRSENGLADYVRELAGRKGLHPDPICITGKGGDGGRIIVDVAMMWTDRNNEMILTYCNNISTHEGGTHLTGFKGGLTRAVNVKLLTDEFKKRHKTQPSGDDIREGLVAVLSVRVPQPQFEGQTKTKLNTAEARTVAETLTYEFLQDKLDDDKLAAIIGQRVIRASKAREAAQRARDAVRKQAKIFAYELPGKLADCQSNKPEECEIFLVEGDSAGGSAKQARSRVNQAILPLKGKIFNTEKAQLKSILDNNEVGTIIASLQAGFGKEFDVSKVRYHKVIIMTDADVDGSHIRTLLLTLFFRHMPDLILHGHLYIAQPPLYKVVCRKKVYYEFDDKGLQKLGKSFGEGARVEISRFKGLGEMPPDLLWDTTMNPETRKLAKVKISDAVEADHWFRLLMGSSVEKRAEFIRENGLKANIDV